MVRYCRECESQLTLTGVTLRDGSKHYHCESCHLDQSHINDPAGSSFWDLRTQHDQNDCEVCAGDGPLPPRV